MTNKHIIYTIFIAIALIANLSSCSSDEEVTNPSEIGACFKASDYRLLKGELVVFENCTVNGNSFLWDFGDGNTSTDRSPIHTYQRGGIFPVVLTASKDGVSQIIADTIEVAHHINVEIVQDAPAFGDPDTTLDPIILKVTDENNEPVYGVPFLAQLSDLPGNTQGGILDAFPTSDENGLVEIEWTLGGYYDVQELEVKLPPAYSEIFFSPDSTIIKLNFESQVRYFLSASINDEVVTYDNSTQDVEDLKFRAYWDESSARYFLVANFLCTAVPQYSGIQWAFETMGDGCGEYTITEGTYAFDDDPDPCEVNHIIDWFNSLLSIRVSCESSTGNNSPGPEGLVTINKATDTWLEGTFNYVETQCIGAVSNRTCLEGSNEYVIENGTFRIPVCNSFFGDCY